MTTLEILFWIRASFSMTRPISYYQHGVCAPLPFYLWVVANILNPTLEWMKYSCSLQSHKSKLKWRKPCSGLFLSQPTQQSKFTSPYSEHFLNCLVLHLIIDIILYICSHFEVLFLLWPVNSNSHHSMYKRAI